MAPISVMSVPVSELRPRFSWVRSVSRPNLTKAGEMRQGRGLNRGELGTGKQRAQLPHSPNGNGHRLSILVHPDLSALTCVGMEPASPALFWSTIVVVVLPAPGKRESSIHPQTVPIELPVVTFQSVVTLLERAWTSVGTSEQKLFE